MNTRTPWFDLRRHDDEAGPDAPPTSDPGNPDDDGTAALGDKGKQALDRMKAERDGFKRQLAEEKRQREDLATKVAEFEDRDKSDLERATQTAEAASKQAAAATARAVRAEVRALAAGQFADADDASAFLDLSQYTGMDGEIDTAAIQADLAGLLERKPHLAKTAASKGPRPDLSQGARPPAPPADFRTADDGSFASELAKYGLRPRS